MWKLVCGERKETAAIIYCSRDQVPGTERGNSEQQHCPLLAKQRTMCLPHSQVKAFLQDTENFHIKKNDTNENKTKHRAGKNSPLCP